jgi:hypothetical protein
MTPPVGVGAALWSAMRRPTTWVCCGNTWREWPHGGEGHNYAFAYFGGVPRTILYDNTKLAVARILGDGRRMKTRAFAELQSHYLFAEKFGRPGKRGTVQA